MVEINLMSFFVGRTSSTKPIGVSSADMAQSSVISTHCSSD
nr:hypothetical protein [Prevotella fusca]